MTEHDMIEALLQALLAEAKSAGFKVTFEEALEHLFDQYDIEERYNTLNK